MKILGNPRLTGGSYSDIMARFNNEVDMTTLIQTTIISLTPAAAQVVRDLLKERNLDDSYALRAFISGQGCSGFQYGLGLDNKPNETDSVFESQGLKVIVDEVSIQNMSGATIDFIDDERGKGFLLDNPNAPPSCSCESGSCGSGEK
jgi:iron-sulfur cluster insertion protein